MFLTETWRRPSLSLNSDMGLLAWETALLPDASGGKGRERGPIGKCSGGPGSQGPVPPEAGGGEGRGQQRAPFIKKITVHSLHLE